MEIAIYIGSIRLKEKQAGIVSKQVPPGIHVQRLLCQERMEGGSTSL